MKKNMSNNNNPAGRLHNLLKEGHKKAKDQPAQAIWSDLLNVKNDNGLLLRRVGFLMALPSNIKTSMSYIDDINHDIYLRWLPRVETAFSILNFQIKWDQFIKRFDGEIMYGIEICSEMLSRECPEKVINEEQLNVLLTKVDELLEELDKSEFSNDVWLFIYDHLLLIKEAIEEYSIRGIKPLENIFEQTIGGVALTPQIYKESRKSKKGLKFWEVMGCLAIAVTITNGSIQIGQEIVNLLPEPPVVLQNEIQEAEVEKIDNESNAPEITTINEPIET